MLFWTGKGEVKGGTVPILLFLPTNLLRCRQLWMTKHCNTDGIYLNNIVKFSIFFHHGALSFFVTENKIQLTQSVKPVFPALLLAHTWSCILWWCAWMGLQLQADSQSAPPSSPHPVERCTTKSNIQHTATMIWRDVLNKKYTEINPLNIHKIVTSLSLSLSLSLSIFLTHT